MSELRISNSESRIVQGVRYESFIAGALLWFPSVELYDMEVLLNELKLEVLHNFDTKRISDYVEGLYSGRVALKKGLTLDSVLDDGHTLREKLSEIAGENVLERFKKFNVERYLLNKSDKLKDIQEMKEKAGVLLITDNEETYLKLKAYGFKNIDWFKSAVKAGRYFKEHPEELKKYHLVLNGYTFIGDHVSAGEVELDGTLNKLKHNRGTIYMSLSEDKNTVDDSVQYTTYLPWAWDSPTNRRQSKDIFDLLDIIVDHMRCIGLSRKISNQEEFKPIEYPIIEKLPLPTKKGNLKILYLSPFLDEEKTQRLMNVANSLGLDVTFKDDDNYALGKIKDKLGEYDIIIGSHMYSRNLLKMAGESTEQCKDTGRRLVLLVTYDVGICNELNYAYAGELAPKDASLLKTADEFTCQGGEQLEKYAAAILSVAVNTYSQTLPMPLEDSLDLKDAEAYSEEYDSALRKEEEQEKEQIINSINNFDNMCKLVTTYLNYRRVGLIEKSSNGKEIIQNKNGLRIRVLKDGRISLENYYQGKMNYAISFLGVNRVDGFRTMCIKMGDAPSEIVGIYGYKYNKKVSRPAIRSEQLKVLEAFENLVDETLSPLVPKEQPKDNKARRKRIGEYS